MPAKKTTIIACNFAIAALLCMTSQATAQGLDEIVVTATRIPQPKDTIAAALSVVAGKELTARGATDLASALNQVPGVEAPPGGDAGPSSAVPSFWGLHEFDAFLLVVDGVPWGGAFNPGITTLDFTDVERIEVLKGAAPVLYGATSFVGVVQALHYPAGDASNEADVAYGTYGSIRGAAALSLPSYEHYRQSLAVDGQAVGFADARETATNEHLLYRGALDLGSGTLRIDGDLSSVRDVPPSPIIRVGTALTTLTPLNANFNPADAGIDVDKYHLVVGYTQPTAWGVSDTLASFAYSEVTDIRAFLHPDLSGAGDSQQQRRSIDDGYVDTHLTLITSTGSSVIVGADLLSGLGRQTTRNGNNGYTVPLDGSVLPPSTAAIPVNEIGTINDRRLFTGQYVQGDWKPEDRFSVAVGVRLNEGYERKHSSDRILAPSSFDSGTYSKTNMRPTETLGVSYRAWIDGKNEVVVYANARNAFKPAAIDFGPDYRPTLLSPEIAKSYEAGLKGAAANGLLTYQADVFALQFTNLVVATSSAALANAGGEKLRGIEAEVRFNVTADFSLAASAAYHNASYSHYLIFDGTANVDVAGRQLPLAPHVLATAGVLYTPAQGFSATAVARYIGRRYLDEQNTAPVGGYSTVDANVGYGWGRCRLILEGTNLSNQRPPVTSSEFGSESFYLLPMRRLWLRFGYSWR